MPNPADAQADRHPTEVGTNEKERPSQGGTADNYARDAADTETGTR